MLNFEIAPAMQADADKKRGGDGYDPLKFMNERMWIQHALMNRYPEGDAAWAERYLVTFEHLFDTEEDFRSLAIQAHRRGELKAFEALKERLERESAS